MVSTIVNSDALTHLMMMDDESVHMIGTSPAYYGLRKYLASDDPNKKYEHGAEETPEQYVQRLVGVFHEAKRVLRSDGTLWLNIGDSYAGSGRGPTGHNGIGNQTERQGFDKQDTNRGSLKYNPLGGVVPASCKAKDLIGIPWMLAFALRADGWYLRSDIPWIKRNSMPSSVRDRPSSSIEHIFLFSKSRTYYYDYVATMQPSSESYNKDKRPRGQLTQRTGKNRKDYGEHDQFRKQDNVGSNTYNGFNARYEDPGTGLRFMRDSDFFFRTWQGLLHNENGEPIAMVVNPRGYKGAHFACVDTETECLTISGWKRHDQIRIGDDIFTYNIETGKLEIQPLQGIVSYRYSGNLVSVFGRSSNMLMTPNHRCVVTTRDKKAKGSRHPAKIVEAANLRGGMKFPVAAELSFVSYGGFHQPEFYELLGWIISEGYYQDTGSVGINQSFSANPEKCARISHLLKELDIPHSTAIRERTYKGKPSIEQEWHVTGWARAKIRHALPDKYRIPENFLLLPDDCIDAFLSGFVGGDGHIRCDGRICITQKEKQPLDIIQAMFIRRGKSCILSQRGGGMWSAFVTNAKDRCFKDSNESLVNMDYPYDGVVWCPTVQNGTWVARRGGRPFITGNCFPVQLVEPMILAGTSEKGVCPECGAPWVRVTEKESYITRPTFGNDTQKQKLQPGNAQGLERTGGHVATSVETTGWKPSCTCPSHDPIPATILDPFSGSGATGVACQWHNRDYVGIELKYDYCLLQEQRLKENK